MFHINIQPNMLLILLLFLSQENQVQAGNPCHITYGSLDEIVPYCQGSSWLPWDCAKCSSSQHTLTKRLRAICCLGGQPLKACLQECGLPPDDDSETMKCGFVCEPFFNSTTIPPPTTTKSTTRSKTTPATQRLTTKATTTTQSTTTTPSTETSTIIPTTPTTTTRNLSTTTERSTTKPTTTVTKANTLTSSTPISTNELTTESTITIASTQATQHVVISGNVSSISKEDSSISKEDKGSDKKWCVLGPWKLHSDTSNSLSICTIVLICVLVFLVTVLVGIIVAIVRFKKGQTSSDSTLVAVKPKDSVDLSVEIPSQENLQEKDEITGKRSNIAASSVNDIASLRFIGKSNSTNRLMDLQQNHYYSPLPSPKWNKKMADVEAVEDLNTPNNMNPRGSICGDSSWYI